SHSCCSALPPCPRRDTPSPSPPPFRPVELASGGLDRLAKFGVLANKFRDVVGRQPEDVLNDEHLGAAARPGADADRGNRQRLGAYRKSTRLNSSHQIISYAVFCLKKKK